MPASALGWGLVRAREKDLIHALLLRYRVLVIDPVKLDTDCGKVLEGSSEDERVPQMEEVPHIPHPTIEGRAMTRNINTISNRVATQKA